MKTNTTKTLIALVVTAAVAPVTAAHAAPVTAAAAPNATAASQPHALNAARVDRFKQLAFGHGKALTPANQKRTASQEVSLIQTVSNHVDSVEKRANHANANATAALHMIQRADKAIVAVTETVQGQQLEQMNRDRTANQHVQPIVGHDGADGVNGKDGAAGKDGINGVDGKDGVTTIITKVETDTATQNQVKANTKAIAGTEIELLGESNLRRVSDVNLQHQINAANAKLQGDELTQMNRDRTANQHVQPVVGHDGADGVNGKDGAAGKDGINGVDGKDGVTTIITKVETDTATQNQVKANTKAIAGTEIELLGESNLRRVSDANLQHQINAANAKLQGDELAQMNRDRTANQHVQPVVGHDGADGVNGKDGANGKNGIDGAAGKDGINGVDGKDGVTTIITKVETDTATQNQVKANTKAIAGTEIELLGESNLRRVSDANLQHQINAANAKLQGDELTQMNRDRTANQHVQPVVGHDGADGVNGKDGAAGKDGINGVDGKDGVTTIITKVETDTATQNQVNVNTDDLKGLQLQQANRDRTANQRVQPVVGHDGVNGANGKDGVTTVITKVETDTATTQQVSNNAISLRAVRSEQAVQGVFVQRQTTVINQHSARLDQDSAAIAQNSQRIDQNVKRIDETKEDLKRGLNNAAAMSSLHFNGNHDSWALSTGSANGEGAALAGGLQKSLTEHTAVTFQYSDSLSGDYMVGAGIHGDW
ncbi:hypothetical protein [Pectobacterium jejuense]|uniref:hypothetical protein n=1 Tax=Pectobacterium jejuense TaxID=2974022 RepID=UPI00228050D5|nr:hypothetical protein [Pectobacterium jejuense]MCY9849164.1 hypothetical protein [Pectobacterium jejuense]